MCIDAAVEGQAAVVEQEILELGQTPVYNPKLALVEWVRIHAGSMGTVMRISPETLDGISRGIISW